MASVQTLEMFRKSEALYAWTRLADQEPNLESSEQKVEWIVQKVLDAAKTWAPKFETALSKRTQKIDATNFYWKDIETIQDFTNLVIMANNSPDDIRQQLQAAVQLDSGHKTTALFDLLNKTMELDVSSQENLTSISQDMLMGPAVTKLSLAHNRLFKVPSTVTSIKSLTALDLTNTRLENLPHHLKKHLTKLERLNLSANPQLKELPANFWEKWNKPVTVVISSDMFPLLKGHTLPENLKFVTPDKKEIDLASLIPKPLPEQTPAPREPITESSPPPNPEVSSKVPSENKVDPDNLELKTPKEFLLEKAPPPSKPAPQPPLTPAGSSKGSFFGTFLKWTGISALVAIFAGLGVFAFQRYRSTR